MERVMRIELTPSAWKAEALPLGYTRIYGGQGWYRTNILRIFSPPLRPRKLQVRILEGLTLY